MARPPGRDQPANLPDNDSDQQADSAGDPAAEHAYASQHMPARAQKKSPLNMLSRYRCDQTSSAATGK